MDVAIHQEGGQTQGYTLVITEKPDSARRIAEALDRDGKPIRRLEKGVPYYEARRGGCIITVPALGHLYTVAAGRKRRENYPVFDYEWVPRHVAERKARQIRTWLEIISRLAKNADILVDACDYDIEGSLIGYNIIKHACNNRESQAKRMKFSTLTKKELEESYEHPLPHLDFAQVQAGMTRHEVDWLYGINLTRALTVALKNFSGRYFTISTGRVQGPVLKFIADRERQIRTHVPIPFWQIGAQIEINNETFLAQYEKHIIDNRKDAVDILNVCMRKEGLVGEVSTRTIKQRPPFPFNLGSLQAEAYRLFGHNPQRTLQFAQRLYLDALISYPRTDSQKLPRSIGYKAILVSLSKVPEYRRTIQEILLKARPKPNEGRKEDSAHPAIYPTGNLPDKTIGLQQINIWKLVVRRFLAVFGEPTMKKTVQATIMINRYKFILTGTRIFRKGWMGFYNQHEKIAETVLPPIKTGEKVKISQMMVESRFTLPQPRYNPSSLVRQMERSGIGTKATRGNIIQTLYNRKYVENENITPTDVGFAVIQALEKHCPEITSIELTRKIEERINRILKTEERKEDVVEDATAFLKPVMEDIKQNEKEIAEKISQALDKSCQYRNTIGTCLACKTGKLAIIRSKKTGKRFIGCSNYYRNQCRTTFPLPQSGIIRPLQQTCTRCGWPKVLVRSYEKRAWKLCVNPACPQKLERKKNEMQNM